MKPDDITDFLPLSKVTFEPIMDGIEVGRLIGDRTKGAHLTLVRLGPGVRVPLRHYTEAMAGVIIKGRIALPVPGHTGSGRAMEPGDFFSIAAGASHETNNVGEGEALLVFFQDHASVAELD